MNCKTCGVDLAAYKGDWSKLPCLACKNMRSYNRIFSNYTGFFDTGDNGEGSEDMLSNLEEDDPSVLLERAEEDSAGYVPDGFTLRQFVEVKKTVEQHMIRLFAGFIIRFLRMAKENPVMFEVILKKMYFPFMSYSDIGDSLNPPCSKQNVLYHLKHAIRLFPELGSTISIDTRYCGGKYAMTTLAAKARKSLARDRLSEVMYGSSQRDKEYTLKELRSILSAPFIYGAEILDFNPYVKYEEEDRRRRQEKLEREIPDFTGIDTGTEKPNGKPKNKRKPGASKGKGRKGGKPSSRKAVAQGVQPADNKG